MEFVKRASLSLMVSLTSMPVSAAEEVPKPSFPRELSYAEGGVQVRCIGLGEILSRSLRTEILWWVTKERENRDQWPLENHNPLLLEFSGKKEKKEWTLKQGEGRLSTWKCERCSWEESIEGAQQLIRNELDYLSEARESETESPNLSFSAFSKNEDTSPVWTKWTALGLLVAGGTMMAVGGGLWAAQYGGDQEQDLQLRDYRVPGAVTFGVGGALAVVGAFWTWKRFRNPTRERVARRVLRQPEG